MPPMSQPRKLGELIGRWQRERREVRRDKGLEHCCVCELLRLLEGSRSGTGACQHTFHLGGVSKCALHRERSVAARDALNVAEGAYVDRLQPAAHGGAQARGAHRVLLRTGNVGAVCKLRHLLVDLALLLSELVKVAPGRRR